MKTRRLYNYLGIVYLQSLCSTQVSVWYNVVCCPGHSQGVIDNWSCWRLGGGSVSSSPTNTTLSQLTTILQPSMHITCRFLEIDYEWTRPKPKTKSFKGELNLLPTCGGLPVLGMQKSCRRHSQWSSLWTTLLPGRAQLTGANVGVGTASREL